MNLKSILVRIVVALLATPSFLVNAQESSDDVAPIEIMEEGSDEITPLEELSLEENPPPPAIVEEIPPAAPEETPFVEAVPPEPEAPVVAEPEAPVVAEPEAPGFSEPAAGAPEAVASSVPSEDEPDLKRELRFHQIYKMYNETPLPSEVWGEALGKTEAQTYTVQKGDTLWGLSETLFGDTNYWPKIWSINNNEIENPHEILPEQIVEFYPGTLEEPPSMAVDENPADPAAEIEDSGRSTVVQDQPEVKAEPTLEEFQTQLLQMATLPEPSVKSRQAGAIPPSLPSWQLSQQDPKKPDVLFEVNPVNRDFGLPESPLTYFISESGSEAAQAVGSVVETEMGTSTAAEFQYIVVKLKEASSGQKLYAIRKVDQLKDKERKLNADLIQVMGELEVTEVVNEEEGLYRALVKRVINPIQVGSSLIPGEMPSVNASEGDSAAELDARVVAGEHQVQRRLFSQNALVVLNRGASQGASAGQTVRLFRQPLSRNELSKERMNLRPVGTVKIIQTSENFSTGIVVQALDEIRAGDSTRATTNLE